MTALSARSFTAILLANAFAVAPAIGADAWADFAPRGHSFVGTLSCSSASCHASTQPRDAGGSSHGQEYLQWLKSDPHALAGQRINEPRFQEVLKRASNRPDGQPDPRMYERCAKCHDPLATVGHSGHQGSVRADYFAQGIGCETCHGPASDWLTEHYRRDVSRQRLIDLGMVDTKNTFLRARLCAACHVGSAENDVNHDMLAAGHPPLRFEMASHQALLERKHWDDGPRRLAEPDYEVQLWAAGRIASADAALALLEGRAKRAIATNQTQIDTEQFGPQWPELAEHNCFACHQPLRPGVGKPHEANASRGVPEWRTWNVALVSSLLTARAGDVSELPAQSLDATLRRMQEALAQSWFAPPDEIAALAAEAREVLRRHVLVSATGSVLGRNGQPRQVSDVLQAVAARDEIFTWERACHELAALVAVERAIRDQSKPRSVLADWRIATDDRAFDERTRRIATALRFESDRSEGPAVFGVTPSQRATEDILTLDEVGAELQAWRIELVRATQRD